MRGGYAHERMKGGKLDSGFFGAHLEKPCHDWWEEIKTEEGGQDIEVEIR